MSRKIIRKIKCKKARKLKRKIKLLFSTPNLVKAKIM